MENELKVRVAGELSPGPDELRDRFMPYFADKFFRDRPRVLPFGNDPTHVKPVAAGYMGHFSIGQILHAKG